MARSISKFTEPHFVWIIRHVNRADGGWPDQPGKPSSVITTAEAILALLARPLPQAVTGASSPPKTRRSEESELIKNGVEFLIARQCLDEANDQGAWQRESAGTHGTKRADLLRTCKATSAITWAVASRIEAGESVPAAWHDARSAGVAWLFNHRCRNGGWSFAGDQIASPLATCFALTTLLLAKDPLTDTDLEVITAGFNYLEQERTKSGAIGGEGALQLAVSVASLLAVRTCQRKSTLKRPIQPGAEEDLETWITSQSPASFKPVETQIVIDSADPANHYPYTIMLNAAVINLYAIVSPATLYDRMRLWITSRNFRRLFAIVRHCLRSARNLAGEHGGFEQPRAFTWSTCMTVAAISRCKACMTNMPSEKGWQHWAQVALQVSAIVQGACFLAGKSGSPWAKSAWVAVAADVSLWTTCLVGALLGLAKGKSFLDFLQAIVTGKSGAE